MDSCYAVNVGVANGNALCELTGDLSDAGEMQSNVGSSMYVLGKLLHTKFIVRDDYQYYLYCDFDNVILQPSLGSKDFS